MNQRKRKTSFVVIGVILIAVGVIMFIISAIKLYDVQTTTTHWIEGFMQDYQARTNATNSIPCYMFMIFAFVFVIAGIVMLCIKPKVNVLINSIPYNTQSILYCTKCHNQINATDAFCKNCGYNLKNDSQNFVSKITCFACGQVNEQESKFCTKCGKQLKFDK